MWRLASAFFLSSNLGYYDVQRVRLDPIGLDVDWGAVSESDQTRVVFFGDSRAAQWTPPAVEGADFLNRGIGGQTSNQIMLRYDEHVEPLEPDVLVVQMCINEIKTVAIFPDFRDQISGAQSSVSTTSSNSH